MNYLYEIILILGIVCICSATPTENPHIRRRELQMRSNRSSHHVQPSYNNDMMSQIHDRVSVLASLDQAHRTKLDSIENKLTQLDSSTTARLESIRIQQQDTSKQLETIDYMQRNVQSAVGEIHNDLDVIRYGIEQNKERPVAHVHPRQAALPENDTEVLSLKLDSLATFLASTRVSINRIENAISDLGANLTKLTQLTRGAHKRMSILSSRNQLYNNGPIQQPQYPQFYGSYGPPPPPAPLVPEHPSSCAQASLSETGIHKIQVNPEGEPFYALCESAEKGGWTIIQNRFDGSINFNRDWAEYKIGFGNLLGEFFIGMEKLHALTASTLHELMIVLVDFKNQTRTARYGAFAVAGEKEFYALHILGDYSGSAGDSFSFHAGNKFSTFDNDNDGWVEGNCAQAHTGAWWHGACEMSNLNGQYLNGDVDASQQYQGMYWNDFHGPLYSLRAVQMKIRPIQPSDAL